MTVVGYSIQEARLRRLAAASAGEANGAPPPTQVLEKKQYRAMKEIKSS
jgi:hypothetical protein